MTNIWGAVSSTAYAVAAVSASLIIPGLARADYASAVNTLTPDHYYRLNETTIGSVIDSGVTPIDGVHAGSFGEGGGTGVVGIAGVNWPGFASSNKALLANDAGAIGLGPTTSFAGDTMTIALWFKNANPTGLGLTADRLFENNDATSPLTVAHSASYGIEIATGTAEGAGRQIAPTSLWLMNNTWHHLVVTRNGNNAANVSVYVDGVNRTSLLGADPWSWPTSGGTAWIAARDVATEAGLANGAVDEVAIWNHRALTEVEVQGMYNAAVGAAPAYSGYVDAVLDAHPIAYYRFEENAGLAEGDAVRNWVHPYASTTTLGTGTAGFSCLYPDSAPTFAVTGPRPSDSIAGEALGGLDAGNRAAEFLAGYDDGVVDMVNIGANPAWMSEEKTYSLLFKTDKTDRNMRLLVNDPCNDQCDNDLYLLMDAGKLVLVGRHGAGPTADTAGTYNDNQWHHVVAVRTGDAWTDLHLYVDGEQVALNDRTGMDGSWSTALSGRIGAQSTTSRGFRGLLDEVAVWDRAFSTSESLALFDSLIGGTPGPTMLGDANGDGRVNNQDAAILAAHWHQANGAVWANGDFNGDGKIDDKDASILAAHWTSGAEQDASAPEPSAVIMLSSLVLAVFVIQRRKLRRRKE